MGRPALPAGTKTIGRDGYVRIKVPDHPLAIAGWVREHRLVLYEAIGPGVHPCHHCRALVEWGSTLEVDHLDHDRQNNQVQNLGVACRGCQNRHRRFCLSKNSGRPEGLP